MLTKRMAVLLYLPLTVPTVIAWWHAADAPKPVMAWTLAAFGAGLLVVNALVLLAIYRWLLTLTNDATTDGQSSE